MSLLPKIKYCYYCERPLQHKTANIVKGGQRPTKDHVIPLIAGGTGRSINLVDCCSHCNSFKSGLLPFDFLKKVEEYILLKKTFKGYTVEMFQTIHKNTLKVIEEVVNKYGSHLYKIKNHNLTPHSIHKRGTQYKFKRLDQILKSHVGQIKLGKMTEHESRKRILAEAKKIIEQKSLLQSCFSF